MCVHVHVYNVYLHSTCIHDIYTRVLLVPCLYIQIINLSLKYTHLNKLRVVVVLNGARATKRNAHVQTYFTLHVREITHNARAHTFHKRDRVSLPLSYDSVNIALAVARVVKVLPGYRLWRGRRHWRGRWCRSDVIVTWSGHRVVFTRGEGCGGGESRGGPSRGWLCYLIN